MKTLDSKSNLNFKKERRSTWLAAIAVWNTTSKIQKNSVILNDRNSTVEKKNWMNNVWAVQPIFIRPILVAWLKGSIKIESREGNGILNFYLIIKRIWNCFQVDRHVYEFPSQPEWNDRLAKGIFIISCDNCVAQTTKITLSNMKHRVFALPSLSFSLFRCSFFFLLVLTKSKQSKSDLFFPRNPNCVDSFGNSMQFIGWLSLSTWCLIVSN